MTDIPVTRRQAKLLKNIGDSLQCPVCLFWFVNPKVLSCGHAFCSSCLVYSNERCHNKYRYCHVCRAKVRKTHHPVSSIHLRHAVEATTEAVRYHNLQNPHCLLDELISLDHTTEEDGPHTPPWEASRRYLQICEQDAVDVAVYFDCKSIYDYARESWNAVERTDGVAFARLGKRTTLMHLSKGPSEGSFYGEMVSSVPVRNEEVAVFYITAARVDPNAINEVQLELCAESRNTRSTLIPAEPGMLEWTRDYSEVCNSAKNVEVRYGVSAIDRSLRDHSGAFQKLLHIHNEAPVRRCFMGGRHSQGHESECMRFLVRYLGTYLRNYEPKVPDKVNLV